MTYFKTKTLLYSTAILFGLGVAGTQTVHADTQTAPTPDVSRQTQEAPVSTPATEQPSEAQPVRAVTAPDTPAEATALAAPAAVAAPAELSATPEAAPAADPTADETPDEDTTADAPAVEQTMNEEFPADENLPTDQQNDVANQAQVARVNVKDYEPTSDQNIDWHNYQHVVVNALDEDSNFGYQVKKFGAAYEAATGQTIDVEITNQAQANAITVTTDDTTITNSQAYKMTITADGIAINASSEVGAVYALTTLSQMAATGQALPLGVITDAPEVETRSVQVDNGRKYYSKDWFLTLIDEMAASKANLLVMHFSEKTGFGIESDVLPADTLSTQYLTKDEVREIIAYANQNFITVTPELDMPGHLAKVLNDYPDLKLVQDRTPSAEEANYLDVTNPASVKLMESLIDEYADLFGTQTPYFDFGADEYLGDDWRPATIKRLYPKLYEASVAKYGDQATGTEAFYDFVNEIDDYIQSKGYTARVYHDRLLRGDQINVLNTLNHDMVIKYWTHCRAMMPSVDAMTAQGFHLLNYSDAYIYYVLGENAGYKYPVASKIYDEFDNGLFKRIGPNQIGNADPIYQSYDNTKLPDFVDGSVFSIWSDNFDAQTEAEVAAKATPAIRAFLQKAWGVDSTIDYATYSAVADVINAAGPADEAINGVKVVALTEPATSEVPDPAGKATQTNGDATTVKPDQGDQNPATKVPLSNGKHATLPALQKAGVGTLPQTGDQTNTGLAILGLLLTGLVGLLGFSRNRRQIN